MRAKHRITIERAMEVIEIDGDGRLVFRCGNGHSKAGDVARFKIKKNRPCLWIDRVQIPAAKVAWMIQKQEYPINIPMTRNHSRYDFSMQNLTLNVEDLIWGDV